MHDVLLRARSARAASRDLRERCRRSSWDSFRARHQARLVRRRLFGPIYCADGVGAGLRVLVVDDLDSVRTSFATVLRTAGFEVIEAADGFLALEALKLFQFDAMLLDLAMPVLDGHGVLDRMDGSPPVVIVTGGDYRPTVEAYGEQIFGVVTKPVAPEVLIALLGEAATAGRAARR